MKVSYILLCYEQELYVREAIQSALGQYSVAPIEFIFSDDSSSDATFQIIQEECAMYTGPHDVIIRRTQKNLGIVGHLNELVALAQGQLIVLGAGDDVARLDKTKTLVEAWKETGAMVYGCNPNIIDAAGRVIGRLFSKKIESYSWQSIIIRNNSRLFISAFDRAIFDQFGMLPEECLEDQQLAFRGALLGSICMINEPLVSYRRHENNISSPWLFSQSGANAAKTLCNKLEIYLLYNRAWLKDLTIYSERHPLSKEEHETVKLLLNRIEFYKLIRTLLDEKHLFERMQKMFYYLQKKHRKNKLYYMPISFLFVFFPKACAALIQYVILLVREFSIGLKSE